MKLKILVAGAGAIGQWLGARLQASGHEVLLWTTPRHVAALTKNLRVHGLTSFEAPTHAVAEVPGNEPFDAVILTCKAHATAALAPQAASCLAPSGTFITLQNGFGNLEKVRRRLPADRVAVALTSHGVTVERPGLLHHAGTGATLVGPSPGGSPDAARRAQSLLSDAGLDPEWHDAMRPYVWRKAILNAGINPVGAVAGLRNGDLLDQENLWSACEALVREGTHLAEAAQVNLPPGNLVDLTRTTLKSTSANFCSMLQDVRGRRPTEIEQLTGRMVRLAERLAVPLPHSKAMYRRVKDLEGSYLGLETSLRLTSDEKIWEGEPF